MHTSATFSLRKQLLLNGYSIIPCRGKIPAIGGWNAIDYVQSQLTDGPRGTALQRLERWEDRFPLAKSTGSRIENGLLAIDGDINDTAAVDYLLDRICEIAPDVGLRAPTRFNSDNEKVALFCRLEGEAFVRVGSRKYKRPGDPDDKYHAVEIFGGKPFKSGVASRQFALYGPRSHAKDGTVESSYVWAEGVPALHEVPLADLPTLNKAQAFAIVDAFEAFARAAGWVQIGVDDGDGEGHEVFDLDRDLSQFEVVGHGLVGYAELEEIVLSAPGQDIRCTANFIAGEVSDKKDRCAVRWSNRHDCLMVIDWKTAAHHMAADRAPVSSEEIAEAIEAVAADAGVEVPGAQSAGEKPVVDDFYSYGPKNQYISRHNGKMWLRVALDRMAPSIQIGVDDKGEPVTITASLWLDRNRAVGDITWAPGYPELMQDMVTTEAGFKRVQGKAIYNRYRPPVRKAGNAGNAERFVQFIRNIYPDHWEHILAFMAHRIQRPGEKINHALVLTGPPGIGKDTMLEPLVRGVGAWNYKNVSPRDIVAGNNNDFEESVVLLISETHDLGETSRFTYYEATKPIMAAPPEMRRINIKYVPQFYIPNVAGVICTTNYPHDGLYLPFDDRRHYVCGTRVDPSPGQTKACTDLWAWYKSGGTDDVVAFLAAYDLAGFDVSAPPEKTEAFWHMAEFGAPSENMDIDDALDKMGNPDAVLVAGVAANGSPELAEWMRDKKNGTMVKRRLNDCGYAAVKNAEDKKGRWVVAGKRVTIYVKSGMNQAARLFAAAALKQQEDKLNKRGDGNIVPFK